MQIRTNTDASIEGRDELAERVEATVRRALSRFSGQITRVEVHLSDVNSRRPGDDDKRCVMEARLAGLRPTAVTHRAATLHQAVEGATEKLKRSIDNTLGRLSKR